MLRNSFTFVLYSFCLLTSQKSILIKTPLPNKDYLCYSHKQNKLDRFVISIKIYIIMCTTSVLKFRDFMLSCVLLMKVKVVFLKRILIHTMY